VTQYSPLDRPRASLRARAGFSILELLIVMLIMGVMAQLSMGRVHAMLNQQRVVHAATAIQNDLEAAFQIAARNRKPVQIKWDSTMQQLIIGDRSGSMFYRKTNLGLQAYGFRGGAVTVSQSPLQIYPNGLAADTLLITISSNGVTKKVRMSRAGLVQTK
jgi:prepilin-type N-terminal cleavage/methylation domain-containing protein